MTTTADVADILEKYLRVYPEERARLQPLIEQAQAGEQLNTRKNFRGHITGAALVLSPDRRKILVIHHRLFNKWLQPGGHWDEGESSPWAAAQREAEEETSVRIERMLTVHDDPSIPLDIGVHPIPPRPELDEPEHLHYDLRYVFIAADEQLQPRKAEVKASVWMHPDDHRLHEITSILKKLKNTGLLVV